MKYNKTALVLGAGGFIGSHLVNDLKSKGYWVRGVDLKYPKFSKTKADEFIIGDLRDYKVVSKVMFAPNQNKMISDIKIGTKPNINNSFGRVYQLAADMGGAGFVFTEENDADIMHNSALINLNVAKFAIKFGINKLFYSSSACVYPEENQLNANNIDTKEKSAYPANPDSNYGWEKLFSERLYLSFVKNYNLTANIARFHNIYGPEGSWNDGREKAPAAFCRKVAMTKNGGEIEMWGNGKQKRSFLYIDECLKGIEKLMNSNTFYGPVNIGSEEMVSINSLAKMIMNIAGKSQSINHISGPTGVKARNSNNYLIKEKLGWSPNYPLKKGIKKTYQWIESQIRGNHE